MQDVIKRQDIIKQLLFSMVMISVAVVGGDVDGDDLTLVMANSSVCYIPGMYEVSGTTLAGNIRNVSSSYLCLNALYIFVY